MREGTGIGLPGLSNRPGVERGNQSPSQELPNVASLSSSSSLGKENMSSNESSLVDPIPLRFIPANIGYDAKNEKPQLLARPCPKLLKTLDSSILDALSIPYTNHKRAPRNSTGHAIPPLLQIGYVASNVGQESTDTHNSAVIESLPSIKQIPDGDKPHHEVMLPLRETNDRHESDKLRRTKISEGIKKFKGIVHCSDTYDKGNQESVLDDTIDYIKYLKLQLKVLSQSRLCGEFTPHPFIYLEGYGHYLLNQKVCDEPLEDMIGLLMEKNPQAAIELMESKGLTIMPMGVAYSLLNPAQASLP